MRSFAPDYDLVIASNLDFAFDLLSRGEQWRPIAGGTDLMVLFNAGKLTWNRLVSVREIPELRMVIVAADHVTIGAAVTYSQIRREPFLQRQFPLLGAAAGWTGGVSNQNRGTLGGNIVNASPAADSPPALLTYDAELEVASRQGSRKIRYCDFHTAYKTVQLSPDELLIRIHLPRRDGGWRDYSRKVGTRRAQAIAKVCVAASAKLRAGAMEDVRIAVGSAAPFPLRCFGVENFLRGKTLTEANIDAACQVMRAEISPISDLRSTAEYRSRVASNLLGEFLGGLR